MILHFTRIIVITALTLILIFLPFMPGEYDASAVIISTMAQLFGFSSLLFVPLGIAWLIYEIVKQRKKEQAHSSISYVFGAAALIILVIVILATSLGAFANHSIMLAIITMVAFSFIILKLFTKLKQLKNTGKSNFDPTPYYLIFIPVVVVFVRSSFIVPAIENSRNIAIKQSEEYIRDIEAYYNKNGRYPVSLLSLWSDYKTSVKGIKQFRYEQWGNAYNVYFEQFSNEFGIKEIVMYNKLGEHEMTSHDTDLLQLSPDEQDRQRGYISVHDLPQKNWKYFWFD